LTEPSADQLATTLMGIYSLDTNLETKILAECVWVVNYYIYSSSLHLTTEPVKD